jgi:ribosome-binding factor A
LMDKAPSQRRLRVGEEIRRALIRIFDRGELRDPDLIDARVTVAEVRVSPDLKNATVYVAPFAAPLAGGDSQALVKACKRAAPFLRGRVAQEMNLRHVPRLGFEADTTFDAAEAMNRLLASPHVARDLSADDESPDEKA